MNHIPLSLIFFDGEIVFLEALLVLGLLLTGACITSWWLVRRYKARAAGKTWLIGIAPFALLMLLLFGEYLRESPHSGAPYVLNPQQLNSLISGRSGSTRFDIGEMAFFHQKLYAGSSSNGGLIEISDGVPTRTFCPQKECVVSGPWIDEADGLLWIMDDGTHELLHFDGSHWKRIAMPKPVHGYYSRGDVLEGGRFAGDGHHFWMVAASTMWRWENGSEKWVEVASAESDLHDYKRTNDLIGVMPLNGQPFGVIRHQPFAFVTFEGQDPPESDRVASFNGGWQELPNKDGLIFLTDTSLSVQGAGYVCTTEGHLLKVSEQGVENYKTPDACETLGRDDKGQLVASFKHEGIYVLAGGVWQRIAGHPYPSGAGEYWSHLAVKGETVAFAVVGKPVVKDHGMNMRFTTNAPMTLWVGQGTKMKPVQF